MRPFRYPLLVALAAAAVGIPTALAQSPTPTLVLRLPLPDYTVGFGSALATGDVDGDGAREVLVGNPAEAGSAYLYSGSGTHIRTFVPAGPQQGGAFGTALALVGDLNGDGTRDLLVGAPGESAGLTRQGRVRLVSGATGFSLGTLVSPTPSADGRFGHAVAAPGDLSGDGVPDYVVGAYGEAVDGVFGAGRAYVFSGVGGAHLRTLVSPGPSDSGFFGYRVSAAGDLNGDGMSELLVTAPREPVPPRTFGTTGRAHLFDGATGALLRTFASHTPDASPWFGRAAALVGDLDGDGDADLLVSAPEETEGGDGGVVYAFDLATGDSLRAYTSGAGFFGHALAPLGDVDGDGRADFVAGAPTADVDTLALVGALHVVSGATGESLMAFASPNPRLNGYFGYAAAWADIDGDGAPDPMIGAPRERYAPDDTTAYAGAVYVYTSAAIRAALGTTAGAPAPTAPAGLALGAPVPNPVAGRAALPFTLDRAGAARLALYDALGREVAVLAEGEMAAGAHAATLDARGLAPGVYVARLVSGAGSATARVTVAR